MQKGRVWGCKRDGSGIATRTVPKSDAGTTVTSSGTISIPTAQSSSHTYDQLVPPVVAILGSTNGNNLLITADRSANGFGHAAAAGDYNAANVGGALDHCTNPTADMTNILNIMETMSNSQVATALDTMVPQVDAGVLNTSTTILNNFVGVSLDRVERVMKDAKTPTPASTKTKGVAPTKAKGVSTGDEAQMLSGAWGKGYGSYLTQGTRNNISGYDAWNAGTVIGTDHIFMDCLTAGVSGGYAYGNVDSKVNNANTYINSGQGTVYAGYSDQNLPYFVDAAGTFAYNWYNGKRDISVGPTISRTANAAYGGQQYGIYAGGGYNFDITKDIEFTPLLSLQWNHLRMNSYTETEAGALNLYESSQNYDQLQSGVGAKVASMLKYDWANITPEVHGKWFYDFIGDPVAMTSNFTGGGPAFNVNGCKPALSSFNVGGQLELDLKNDFKVTGTCDTELKDEFFGVYGSVEVRYDF